MDEQLRIRLDMLAGAAREFANARHLHRQGYEWLTLREREALDSLRVQVAALAREEAKSRSGMAA